jgi:polygalacturonase
MPHFPRRAACLVALALIVHAIGCSIPHAAEPRHFSVIDFGAKADGLTNDTAAIDRAIAACHSAGGGVVVFPRGTFLSGAIHLRSNVTLHLAHKDTTILFSTDPADYPLVFTRWAGIECYNYSPFIYARDAENIAITGGGMLDGQGRAWHSWLHREREAVRQLRQMGENSTPVDERRFGTEEHGLRPSMIQFVSCRNVLIEGVLITGSPFWTVHPVYCDGVTIRDATIITRGPNTDGINPDSSRNVLIERCFISTGDDCIAIKSGHDKDGRVAGRPSENIIIRNCLMMRGQAAIAIGSEMSGDVRNVRVFNCEVRDTNLAVRIKGQRGRGGVVEDVVIENLKCRNTARPLLDLTLHYTPGLPREPFSERTPVFRNITFRHVTAEGAARAILVHGLEESPIRDVTFENVVIDAGTGAEILHADGVQFVASRIEVASGERFKLGDARNVTLDGREI